MDEQQEGMDVKLVDASCVHEEPMEVGSSCTYAEPHISKDETTNIGNAGVVLHGTKKMAEDLPGGEKNVTESGSFQKMREEVLADLLLSSTDEDSSICNTTTSSDIRGGEMILDLVFGSESETSSSSSSFFGLKPDSYETENSLSSIDMEKTDSE
ncbi:hypothetical protein OTU49_005549 [Cherax quadricarinatus]|uniref:Uncharacterized protein n=1 Tax=Cherax quadricarinatus TaxID=27406 RepID=A0AAW0Y6I0_CHEQU|nr:uncharacterized protein LOC128684182 isoform X1 [Cherax quadricarinatus]